MENERENDPRFFNPFYGRDRAEVWKEIKAKAVHITKEEFYAHIEELRKKKAERDALKSNDSKTPAD